ncbi:Lsr2 family protein [Amycolatopsis sp. NPDC059657]|uniref:histone-like nucleoid-structuring protein Lsr2 n=1 Tax=Amycolatopsis sp. NPDC059657 TaxID=3346899 RepID=UPI00366B677D
MAQRVAVEMVCDIDGTPGADTVLFGLDGLSYSIDLSDERTEDLRQILAPYVTNARRVGGRKVRGTGTPVATTPRSEKPGQMRVWLRANGHPVSDRGRVSADLVKVYEDAHQAPEPVKAKAARKRPQRRLAAVK